ncbi:hypothetical protein M9H77_21008 [Catharanthus roseus]|uniref:Uncharacterized protein n=1 Tax=Catharanthus roseus TaxID=4058 RepID=A0ACC0AN53_CATRO|nr:hypothetical protein M9H77_21008 [Catharanthus roseus]
MVKSLIWLDGSGNNVYTLKMNEKSFSCGKWQEYTLPCSHGLTVCKDNGTRPDAYVTDIYLRETYKRTYKSNFYPVRQEGLWRDAPYNLTFYHPNMNTQRDRKQGTRFLREMDNRNPNSSPKYSRCRMPEHNRKNCNNPSSGNV